MCFHLLSAVLVVHARLLHKDFKALMFLIPDEDRNSLNVNCLPLNTI